MYTVLIPSCRPVGNPSAWIKYQESKTRGVACLLDTSALVHHDRSLRGIVRLHEVMTLFLIFPLQGADMSPVLLRSAFGIEVQKPTV